MTEVVIVGDLGGQRESTRTVLRRLGVGTDHRLPEGLHVVQVGDMIRFAPELREQNTWMAETMQSLIRNNPGRWTQLAGNHECAALGGPSRPHWSLAESFEDDCLEILERLWTQGQVHLAAYSCRSDDDGSPVLITHAGLTRRRWQQMGEPDAAQAARQLNQWVSKPFEDFSEPGSLVTGKTNRNADSLWAEVNLELYWPWVDSGRMPFHQIHGHASPFNWETGEWWSDCPAEVRHLTERDDENRRTTTRVSEADSSYAFHGVDWVLGDAPTSVSWGLPPSSISPPGLD